MFVRSVMRIWSLSSLRSVSKARFFCSRRRHPTEEFIAKDVEAGFRQPCGGEQINHFVGINRAADHLSYGGVDIALPSATGATAGIVSQSFANHRRQPAGKKRGEA